MREFFWLNESQKRKTAGQLIITAPAKTDYFCEGDSPPICNAPYYYTEVDGDFVLKAKISADFKTTFDAAALIIMEDTENWAKCALELTDFGAPAAVSVVTVSGISDDANGPVIQGNTAWFQIARRGRTFAFHYSTDGSNYIMMRYFKLNAKTTVKVGFEAQSPCGDGGDRFFNEIGLEQRTLNDLRKGL